MAASLQVTTFDNQGRQVSFEPPDQCPICHHSIDPRVLYGILLTSLTNPGSPTGLEVTLRCTRAACRRSFLAIYEPTRKGAIPGVQQETDARYWTYLRSLPAEPVGRMFPPAISKTSELFVKIYNQSLAAEGYGLDQLAGPGYRKALEFLVKDYLKSTEPDNRERALAIEQMQLMNCIRNMVKDPNLKSAASRATWLGNDETHYIRKWEGKDIEDLKKLIDLTLYWIASEILTRELEVSMPDPKSSTTTTGD